jgi:diguanylate cyclase (GGDEF)-like protein
MDVQTLAPQTVQDKITQLEGRLAQSCPMAVALVDEVGTVMWANTQARAMVHHPGDDLVGTSVIDFVHPEDLVMVAESMDFATGDTSELMGPTRIRYVDGDGNSRYTYLWAQNFIDDPEINGMIIVLSKEAAHDVLGAAISSAAAGESIDETLGLIAHSIEVAPFDAHAAVLRYTDTTLLDVDVVKSPDAPNFLDRVDPELPWIRSLRLNIEVDETDLARFGPEFDPAVTGINYVWCRSISTSDDTMAVLVVCTKQPYSPTPNQLVQMGRTVEVAQVALQIDSDRTRLKHAATHDYLTGLANRELLASFDSDLSEAAVFFIDLDHFKQINDEHGHAVGDAVLRVTAKRIARSIRSGDLAVRIGGDEFVVVCHPRCSADDAELVAHRILDAVARPISVEGLVLDISASVGIALGSLDCTLADLMASADGALLQVKSSEKGAFNFA